jgi:hypothetical protein
MTRSKRPQQSQKRRQPPQRESTPSIDSVIAGAKAREAREAAYARIIATGLESGLSAADAEKISAAAVANQMTEQQVELEVLKLARFNGGNARRDQQNSAAPAAAVQVEAAVARAMGLPAGELEAMYTPQVLQASEDRWRSGLSIMEVLLMAARRNGFTSDSSRTNLRPLLQAAFNRVEASSASTYDVSGILSNVANKMIAAGFESVEDTWREVSSIKAVRDFKQMSSYSLTGDFEYRQIGNGGELKHATLGEETYTNQADTYGRIFAITRKDLINDDLGAFDRIRVLLGRGAALKFNKVFWTEFLADVTTFYTSGRGNYFEGSTTALDIDSLTAGELLFLNQTDPDGNPLGVSPEILLVPNALKVTSNKLANDTEIRVDGSSAKTTYTTGNPHAGKFRPVSVELLQQLARSPTVQPRIGSCWLIQ